MHQTLQEALELRRQFLLMLWGNFVVETRWTGACRSSYLLL